LPVARRPVRERDDPFVELDFEPDFDRSRDPVFALVREPGLRATLSRSEEPLGLGLARFLLVADALERLAEPVVRLADALARLADPLVLDADRLFDPDAPPARLVEADRVPLPVALDGLRLGRVAARRAEVLLLAAPLRDPADVIDDRASVSCP